MEVLFSVRNFPLPHNLSARITVITTVITNVPLCYIRVKKFHSFFYLLEQGLLLPWHWEAECQKLYIYFFFLRICSSTSSRNQALFAEQNILLFRKIETHYLRSFFFLNWQDIFFSYPSISGYAFNKPIRPFFFFLLWGTW